MKKIRIAMAIAAVVLGITSSFATKVTVVKHSRLNQNLFAISTDGVHFTWATSVPAGYSCQAAKATCEINTSQPTPPANTYPSSYTVVSGADKASAYMPN